MAIVFFASPPDVVSRHITLEFTTGKRVTVAGITDCHGALALSLAPFAAQVTSGYSSRIRTALTRSAQVAYDQAKVLQSSRDQSQRLRSAKTIAQISQANTHRFTVLIDSSSTQGVVEEGESVVAYLMACEKIAIPIGTIAHIHTG